MELSLDQSPAKSGANIIIAIGLTDWKKLAGITKFPSQEITLSVCSSAKNVNDTPACSNAAQKKITKKAKMKITAILCLSIFVSGLLCSWLASFLSTFLGFNQLAHPQE